MSPFGHNGFKGKIFRILVFLIMAGTILPFIVMWLWNFALVPVVDGIHYIAYWQALGLLVLARILFGGFRPRGGGPWQGRPGFMRSRWKKMSEEEKSRFREEWKKRCGPSPEE